jgi:hypothetical protein
MHTRSLLGALALLSIPLAACASSAGGGGAGGSPPATTDSVCDTDPRAETYVAGMSATSLDGSLKMSLMAASPAPPARGLNAWTVAITDASGAPLSGATIALKPFMPDHGHGASVIPQVTPMATQGTFDVQEIDLFMPGIWTNTFTITPASGPDESVVFTFCING